MSDPKKSAANDVTLREIAARLGLGKSTVHRALNDSSSVLPETRRRVQEAAAALGYRKDLFFSALAARREQERGARVRLDYFDARTKPDARRSMVFRMLERTASRMGYEIVCAEEPKNMRAEALARMLWARGSAGFLLRWTSEDTRRGLMRFGGVPILSLRRGEATSLHTVRYDAAGAVAQCWARLWAAGWRRIGCAIMRHAVEIEDDRDRLGAALSLAATRLDKRDRVPPLTCEIEDYGGYFKWLKRHRPEAVIGFSSIMGVKHREAGFEHIPYVSLHAFNNSWLGQIGGTMEPMEEWAVHAIKQMDVMIRHRDIGVPAVPVHTVLAHVWHPGDGVPSAQ